MTRSSQVADRGLAGGLATWRRRRGTPAPTLNCRGTARVGFVNRDDERSRLLVPDDAAAHVAIALERRSPGSYSGGTRPLGAAALNGTGSAATAFRDGFELQMRSRRPRAEEPKGEPREGE
jgi:hypothetical protein